MSRIIAGRGRGRRLKSPPGQATRPTGGRVRQTLFDILAPEVPGCRFLDAFAGNGGVGLEAWANEVLVKELEAAYRSRETGAPGLLPAGSRGIYVLREGESLSRVAKAFYGDAGRWRDLVEANKDKIPDPDMVKAGTIIVIPE